MSRWVDFVKEFAKRKGLSYGCALSDPDCSQEYRYKYKEGKLSADQRKAIKSKEPKEPRTRMSDFYEITGVVEEEENPMPNKTPPVKVKGKKLVKGSQEAKDRMSEIRALAKNAGRPKGSKNKVKKALPPTPVLSRASSASSVKNEPTKERLEEALFGYGYSIRTKQLERGDDYIGIDERLELETDLAIQYRLSKDWLREIYSGKSKIMKKKEAKSIIKSAEADAEVEFEDDQ
jgi:hypothetical protein